MSDLTDHEKAVVTVASQITAATIQANTLWTVTQAKVQTPDGNGKMVPQPIRIQGPILFSTRPQDALQRAQEIRLIVDLARDIVKRATEEPTLQLHRTEDPK